MYKRVLIKLSGEALLGNHLYGTSDEICQRVAQSIKELVDCDIQIALVIGGGNICRGIEGVAAGMERVAADQMGMLATVINGLALQQALSKAGCKARVLSVVSCSDFVEAYHWNKAINYLESGWVTIFTGGTGVPLFSTDTAAALRAIEVKAQILLKATKVNGVYDKDPVRFKDAIRYDQISYKQVLQQELKAMDLTATALCMEHSLPILVFDIFEPDSLKKAAFKEDIGTLITNLSRSN